MKVLRVIAWLPRLAWFAGYFLKELTKANALVAWEVATPRHNMRPGIVRVPIRCANDLEITMLGNLISLTPGTLTLEVTDEKDALFVHGLHIGTPEAARKQIGRLEDRLLAVMRWL
jgi:multicomponent Na+:H+ antiporter subunit E